MASKDSDSDEYEIMVPTKLPEQMRGTQGAAAAKDKKDKHKKSGGKKRGLFRRMSTKQKKENKIKEPASSGPPPRAQSTSPGSGHKTVAKFVPVTHQDWTIPHAQPPKPGPKPPRRLSEEDTLKQFRKQQKEAVAAARQDRLRKTSEPGPASQHIPQSVEHERDYIVDRSYGEVDTEEIVNQYSSHLPLEVVVSKGVYGMDEKYSLATSDRCVIHFIKKRELIQIQDPKSNGEFSVPINTAIKFGVVYNPNSNEAEAMKGFNFQYVSDILAQAKMPKMGIMHLQDPDILEVESIEVVVLKEVIFPDDPIDPRKLRVYSITGKSHRDLLETQVVRFCTTPSFLQMHLPDILKHVPDPCPLHVAMYRNPLGRPLIAPGIPSSMFRRQLYMKKRFTDILLVATGCSEGPEKSTPFEIPTDIDVEYEVVKLSHEDKDRLIKDSKELKEKLIDKDIRHHRYNGVSDQQHRMQQSLYKSTREVGDKRPDEALDDDYVRATSGNRLAMNHRVELLEENMKRSGYSLAEAKATIAHVANDNAQLTEKVSGLEELVAQRGQQVDTVCRQLDSIFTDMEHMKADLAALGVTQHTSPLSSGMDKRPGGFSSPLSGADKGLGGSSPFLSADTEPEKTSESKDACERNKELLSYMTQTEVLKILELAGLGQYAASIVREKVSGDILAECDEAMLETEMGIKSKLHRLKLLRIIQGKASQDFYKFKLID